MLGARNRAFADRLSAAYCAGGSSSWTVIVGSSHIEGLKAELRKRLPPGVAIEP
jgi:hypothetical protein